MATGSNPGENLRQAPLAEASSSDGGGSAQDEKITPELLTPIKKVGSSDVVENPRAARLAREFAEMQIGSEVDSHTIEQGRHHIKIEPSAAVPKEGLESVAHLDLSSLKAWTQDASLKHVSQGESHSDGHNVPLPPAVMAAEHFAKKQLETAQLV